MEYYAAFKRKEILTHVTKWVNLEDSKSNNLVAKGQILYDSPYVRDTRLSDSQRESQIVVARGWDGEGNAALFNGYRVLIGNDNTLETDDGGCRAM